MRKIIGRLCREEDGQAVVLFALAFTVILGCAALVVDLGQGFVNKERMQNAADAAALAAAKELPDKQAAAARALDIAELNGAKRENVTVTVPFDGDSNMVEVICSKETVFGFARALGFEKGNSVGRAVAKASPMGGPFKYTIFSGSKTATLPINNANARIDGGVHSNAGLQSSGTSLKVGGNVEAVKNLDINYGNVDVSGVVQGASFGWSIEHNPRVNLVKKAASFVEMPDFSDYLISSAKAAGLYVDKKGKIDNKGIGHQLRYVNGEYQLVGDTLNVDGSIFVDGDLLVSCSRFTGNGFIIATGNIKICTGYVRTNGSSVGIYSMNKNILLTTTQPDYSMGDPTAEGLIYAPKGKIECYVEGLTFKGRLIANEVAVSCTTLDVRSTPGDVNCLPRTEVALVE